jgi:hypothetical protein
VEERISFKGYKAMYQMNASSLAAEFIAICNDNHSPRKSLETQEKQDNIDFELFPNIDPPNLLPIQQQPAFQRTEFVHKFQVSSFFPSLDSQRNQKEGAQRLEVSFSLVEVVISREMQLVADARMTYKGDSLPFLRRKKKRLFCSSKITK